MSWGGGGLFLLRCMRCCCGWSGLCRRLLGQVVEELADAGFVFWAEVVDDAGHCFEVVGCGLAVGGMGAGLGAGEGEGRGEDGAWGKEVGEQGCDGFLGCGIFFVEGGWGWCGCRTGGLVPAF